MKKSLKKNKKGFTLVEMIVVIAIIGVLAAMMVPALLGFVDRAYESNMNAAAAGLGRGIEALLLEPEWADIKDDVYTGSTTSTTLEFTGTKTGTGNEVNEKFANEIKQIAGTEYKSEDIIYITIKAASGGSYPTLTSVVYSNGKDTSITSSASNSSKNVGFYGK